MRQLHERGAMTDDVDIIKFPLHESLINMAATPNSSVLLGHTIDAPGQHAGVYSVQPMLSIAE